MLFTRSYGFPKFVLKFENLKIYAVLQEQTGLAK